MEYLAGVLIALVVEGVKKFVNDDAFTTHAVLIALSVIGAGLFTWAQAQAFWPVALQVIVSASAFHNLIIRKFYSTE